MTRKPKPGEDEAQDLEVLTCILRLAFQMNQFGGTERVLQTEM